MIQEGTKVLEYRRKQLETTPLHTCVDYPSLPCVACERHGGPTPESTSQDSRNPAIDDKIAS